MGTFILVLIALVLIALMPPVSERGGVARQTITAVHIITCGGLGSLLVGGGFFEGTLYSLPVAIVWVMVAVLPEVHRALSRRREERLKEVGRQAAMKVLRHVEEVTDLAWSDDYKEELSETIGIGSVVDVKCKHGSPIGLKYLL